MVMTPSSPFCEFRGSVATSKRPPATRMRVCSDGNVRSATTAPVSGSIFRMRASGPFGVPSVCANNHVPSVASAPIGFTGRNAVAAVQGSIW